MEDAALDKTEVVFHGVRGSMPAAIPQTRRFGGHTLCIEIASGASPLVLIDAGTGITRLDAETLDRVLEYHILFTHYHWDHIQGLPFFGPLYDPEKVITFHGHTWNGMGVAETLASALRPPLFPVSIGDTAAQKRYVTVSSSILEVGDLTVTAASLHHPQGVTAYRIDGPRRSIVIATDCERGDPGADAALRGLATGADILVHDAQYDPEEYERRHIGWGHSTWAQAAQAARDVGVDRLVLISHDPDRTDDDIETFVARAVEIFPNTAAAFEGMRLDI